MLGGMPATARNSKTILAVVGMYLEAHSER
jgi:hypothetical protein